MSGFALPRVQFDYMMFKRSSQLVREYGGHVIQGFSVNEVISEEYAEGHRITGVAGKVGGKRANSPVCLSVLP